MKLKCPFVITSRYYSHVIKGTYVPIATWFYIFTMVAVTAPRVYVMFSRTEAMIAAKDDAKGVLAHESITLS